MTKQKTIADLNITTSFGCDSTEDYYSRFSRWNIKLINLKIIPNTYIFYLRVKDKGYQLQFIIKVEKNKNSLISLMTRIDNIIINSLGIYPLNLINFKKINDDEFDIFAEEIPF